MLIGVSILINNRITNDEVGINYHRGVIIVFLLNESRLVPKYRCES